MLLVCPGPARLNVMHSTYIWTMHKTVYFHFCADSLLCLPRLHPSAQGRRLLGALSKYVIDDPQAGPFQIGDTFLTRVLIFDEFY